MCGNKKYYSTALTPVFGVNVDTVDRKPVDVGCIDLSRKPEVGLGRQQLINNLNEENNQQQFSMAKTHI